MNITFVGAHQDDEMFCLGTLLRYRQRGDRLSLICTTNGDKGMSDLPDVPHDKAARIRDGEMRQVAERLGADYQCLGEPDEALYDTWDLRVKMIDAFRRTQPDVIFTHFHRDYNLDHITTSQLVFQCAMLSPIASVRTPHAPLEKSPPIYYVDPGPGYGFEGTHFVEITASQVEEMVGLIALHASQNDVVRRSADTDYVELTRKRLAETGSRVGVPFAEVFRPCLAARRIPLAGLLP